MEGPCREQEAGRRFDVVHRTASSATWVVWEAADGHLLAVYGFSIVNIAKNNPKTKTIHFGGMKGKPFANVTHPNGLLFATQFAQIALVVMEKAAFEDMRSRGLVPPRCAFAGHSLGEYSALASITNTMSIASHVDVVFYRGITMQRAVERDAQNRYNYDMCAVNPGHISPSFNDATIREVVKTISPQTETLLEIMNFSVETLTNVLNFLKKAKIDIGKSMTIEKVKEMLGDIVDECHKASVQKQRSEGYIKLEHGFATIPLPGIDVPFHFHYLSLGRGHAFPRISLQENQSCPHQSRPPHRKISLKAWEEEAWDSPAQRQQLTYIILTNSHRPSAGLKLKSSSSPTSSSRS
ncbi:hypothetical protein M407DRAFT_30491 [Tulasnella calospora MUT 4182]|uniref:Malonyl-CoA:ACP transacylase (MAT) domain-containing protein n=1 Tax=Tulasnella calospora MUT 4182 TaxID=1051891 RepID=A0A0C3Q839_9AGAM|nr:hypothetical protein M407DRAFT_30491 [Tulasnella calospora MUT 4182]